MAILNIRNLDPEVHKALRLRAAKAGRSMEAEAREILTLAVAPRAPKAEVVAEVQAAFDRLYGDKKPKNASDELIKERRREARREWSRSTPRR
jgi:plasmid stability protein